jgi:cytochrome c-type biogenesis protein CcmH
MRRLVVLVAAVSVLAPTTASGAVAARTSLTAVENDVMCVVCNEPLAVSRSPQADRERAFISSLVANGDTKAQIERALVAQYGPSVLALPPAHGFNLTVYVLPPAIVVLGVAGLAFALPRWRRRTRGLPDSATAPRLAPADARRLDEDLARHGD